MPGPSKYAARGARRRARRANRAYRNRQTRAAYSLDPRLVRPIRAERRRVRRAQGQARTFRRTPTYRRYQQQRAPQGRGINRQEQHRKAIQGHRKRVAAKTQREIRYKLKKGKALNVRERRIVARRHKSPSADAGDPGGFRRAERFKRTPQYRSDIRAAIRAGSPATRKSALAVARRHPNRIESRVALGEVSARRRRRELAQAISAADPNRRAASRSKRLAQQKLARLMDDPSNRRLLRRMQAQSKRAEQKLANRPVGGTVAAGVKVKAGLGPAVISLPTSTAQIKGLIGAVAAPALAAGEAAGGVKIPGLGGANGVRGTLGRISGGAQRDIIDIPAQAPAGVYMTGRAALKAAKGDSREAEKLWEDYKKTSAVALAAQGKWKEAGKAAEQHPVATGLEVWGGKGVVGRGTGSVLRRTTPKGGSTKRRPLRVAGTNLEIGQTYSRDVITKANQKRKERRAVKKGRDPFAASDRPRSLNRGDIQSHVDRIVDLTEQKRRLHRDKTHVEARKDLPKKKKKSQRRAVPLIVERTIRKPETVRDDLAKEAKRLERSLARENLTHSERRDVQSFLSTVKDLQKDKEFLSDPSPAFAAAERYIEREGKSQAELSKAHLLDPEQQKRAALVPYAVRQMGARYDRKRQIIDPKQLELGTRKKKGESVPDYEARVRALAAKKNIDLEYKAAPVLTDATGRKLETPEIEAHMKAANVKPPGFFSEKPNMRGAKNFYINALSSKAKRHTITSKTRTGESVRKGTYDIDPEVLVEQSVKTVGDVDAAKAFDSVIKHYGMRKQDGSYFRSWEEATRVADDLREAGGPDFVPMRIGPAKREHMAALKEDVDPEAMDEVISSRLSKSVAEAMEEGDGQTVLVPAAAKQRLLQHDMGSESKAWQQFTQGFKRAVLPFSPKWLFGNAFEVTMRSAFYGLGPTDYLRGKRLIKRMEEKYPEAAEALKLQTVGGGHFAALGRQQIHQPVGQMSKLRKGYETARRTPLGVIPKSVRRTQDVIFALNTKFEAQPQYAALGKLAKRDAQEARGHWNAALHVSDAALDDVAKGLVETKNQIRYARQLEEIFGLWGKRSPEARRWLINYTPFGQWAHNALKFVYITLPKKHPVKTAILAGIYEMTDEERRKLGLTLFPHEGEKGVRDYLQGSISTRGSKGIRWGGFTSFGVTADLPGFLESQVLPQASVLPYLGGVDWKGDKLKDDKGEEITDPYQRAKIGLNAQFAAMIPLWSQTQRYKARGRFELSDSTLLAGKYPKDAKKLPPLGTLERIFSPVRETELLRAGEFGKSKKKKGVFGSTGGSSSGSVFTKKAKSSGKVFE